LGDETSPTQSRLAHAKSVILCDPWFAVDPGLQNSMPLIRRDHARL
jgi:hypothetical protein